MAQVFLEKRLGKQEKSSKSKPHLYENLMRLKPNYKLRKTRLSNEKQRRHARKVAVRKYCKALDEYWVLIRGVDLKQIKHREEARRVKYLRAWCRKEMERINQYETAYPEGEQPFISKCANNYVKTKIMQKFFPHENDTEEKKK